MKKKLFEFTCPACSHSFYLMKDTYLLVDEKDPASRRLKERVFFLHQCQSCGYLFELNYPLLVRNPHRDYTLVLSSSSKQHLPYGSVLTRTPRQFLDAFMILELGLDLQKTLTLTRLLEEKYQAVCQLIDYDSKTNMLWYLCNENVFAVSNSFHHLA